MRPLWENTPLSNLRMHRLYCCLRGGLGNQLFQIAKAVEMAKDYECELIVDDGWYKGRRPQHVTCRKFWLDYFSLDFRLPSRRERFKLNLVEYLFKLQKILNKAIFPIHSEYLLLDKNILEARNSIYLHGYWQQYAVASRVRDELMSCLRFRDNGFSRVHDELAKKISSDENSVMLHVRCGDYIWDERVSYSHGNCSKTYYADALQELQRRIGSPSIYLFSDDIRWAKDHLPLSDLSITVISSRGHEREHLCDLADFDLMRRCRHAVIANSSFSWWAAFLLKSTNSIVIAPKDWHRFIDMTEIYDPDWIVL